MVPSLVHFVIITFDALSNVPAKPPTLLNAEMLPRFTQSVRLASLKNVAAKPPAILLAVVTFMAFTQFSSLPYRRPVNPPTEPGVDDISPARVRFLTTPVVPTVPIAPAKVVVAFSLIPLTVCPRPSSEPFR